MDAPLESPRDDCPPGMTPFDDMRSNMDHAHDILDSMSNFIYNIETFLNRLDAVAISSFPHRSSPSPTSLDLSQSSFKFSIESNNLSEGSGSAISPKTLGGIPQQVYDPVTRETGDDDEEYDPRQPGKVRIDGNVMIPGFVMNPGVPPGKLQRLDLKQDLNVDGTGNFTNYREKQASESSPDLPFPKAKKRKREVDADDGTGSREEENMEKYWPKSWHRGSGDYMADGEESPELPKAPPPTATGLMSEVDVGDNEGQVLEGMIHGTDADEELEREIEKELNRALFGNEYGDEECSIECNEEEYDEDSDEEEDDGEVDEILGREVYVKEHAVIEEGEYSEVEEGFEKHLYRPFS
ncbi:hypothetical protein EG329_006554 [Mollisiaceae sp. DMI_Dod_QoI]|nr:hypothetical protein EG329_006554 [Helotiales sp. DMI_Dod_QoI]